MRRFCVVITAAVLLHGGSSSAQVLYKYVDDKGRVTYSGEPPGVDEKRTVTRIDTASQANVVQGPRAGAASARIASKLEARDAQIDKLQAEIEAAKKRLAEAEAARDGGAEMLDEERQWTLSRPDPGARPDKEGKLPGRDGKVVCQVRDGPSGKRAYCPPIAVPNEAYYERQARLSQAVVDTQRALNAAIDNFRRNAPN